MAVSTAIKKNRSRGVQNHPLAVLYGEFVVPVGTATYHLWDLPYRARVIDAYVEVTVAAVHGAGALTASLAVLDNDDVAAPDATTEEVIAIANPEATGLTRMIAGSNQIQAASTTKRQVLAYYRGTTADTSGETIRVMALVVRDDSGNA